jgi:hypothetical protein
VDVTADAAVVAVAEAVEAVAEVAVVVDAAVAATGVRVTVVKPTFSASRRSAEK